MGGFNPAVLHAILKSVIFIGDFDSALVKSVEDELVAKIMSRYETERCEKVSKMPVKGSHSTTTPPLIDDIARDFVEQLIDDASSGVEIANSTEKMLGVFKVSHISICFLFLIDDHLSHLNQYGIVASHRVTRPFIHRHFALILRRGWTTSSNQM